MIPYCLGWLELAGLGTVVLVLAGCAYAGVWILVAILARLRVEWDQRRRRR